MKYWKCGILMCALPLIMIACINIGHETIKGSGKITSENRSVKSFEKIDASGSIDIILTQGAPAGVRIETDDNILPYIELKQIDDKIEIFTRDGVNISPSQSVKVYITTPTISDIDLSGSVSIKSNGIFTSSKKLSVSTSGSAQINLNVEVISLATDVSGTGNITLKGKAQSVSIGISGGGEAHCFDLQTESASLDISGSGSADVTAYKNLNVDISGSGSVRYKGTPSIQQDISGSGNVQHVN